MSNLKTSASALLFAFITAFLAAPSLASVSQTGTITVIVPEGSNVVSIWLSGTAPTNECPNAGGRWTVQTDDPLFKTKMAVLLTAAATGKVVTLASTGTCGNWNSNIIYYVAANF